MTNDAFSSVKTLQPQCSILLLTINGCTTLFVVCITVYCSNILRDDIRNTTEVVYTLLGLNNTEFILNPFVSILSTILLTI